MCGICFIYHIDGQSVSLPELDAMTNALIHRGPDGQGREIIGFAGLGHTRLSIVDIERGHQPMYSNDRRYLISYNGEIYNYQALRQQLSKTGVTFNSQCDTEVILEAYRQYGKDCVSHLRGMFAFIILDTQTQKVFIARDRLGIKPLFYHFNGTSFYAASEMKSLFASNAIKPRFNKQSIRNHFTYQFSVSPYTLFEEVLELPAGHTLSLEPGQPPLIEEYWDLHFPEEWEEDPEVEDDIWIDKFEAALVDAAKSHTIGEVPIGAYLSGGIDSSVTTYLLKEHYTNNLDTFSIHITNPDSDESSAYRPVAEFLGVNNFEMDLNDDQDNFLELLEKALWHLEQPQRMAVDIPHFMLSDFVRQKGIKVVYTGDGADEIMGGYDCFRQDNMRCWANEAQDEGVRAETYMNQHTQYFSHQYMDMLLELHKPENQLNVIDEFGTYPAWYDAWHILKQPSQAMFAKDFKQATDFDTQMPQLVEQMKPHLEGRHPLNQSLYIETKTRFVNWILWKSDRLSMAHSVEARVPFVDHLLVETAANLPCHLKLMGMDEKYVLKAIAKDHLPPLQGDYKKRAFYTPIREWIFKPEMTEKLQKYIGKNAIEESAIFSFESVNTMYDELIQFPKPSNLDEYYTMMRKEWILMLVLSTQILYFQFIKGLGAPTQ